MGHARWLWFVFCILFSRCAFAFIGTGVPKENEIPTYRHCLIAGSSYHVTFDGLAYDSPGMGRYLVARQGQDWHIVVAYNNCEREELCTLSLTTKLAGDITVEMTGSIVMLNDEIIEVNSDSPVTDHSNLVEISREDYVILTTSGSKIHIKFDLRKNILISIKTDSLNTCSLTGLCGNANGDPTDDLWMEQTFQYADNRHIDKFVASYEIRSESLYSHLKTVCNDDSNVEQAALGSCNLLLAAEFQPCKDIVDLQLFVRQCFQKYRSASPWARTQVVCDHFEMVDLLCSIEGVVLSWRTEYFCPKKCLEADFVFRTNQPACHRTCAHANNDMPVECTETRVSMCTCPDKTYLQHNKCVPKEECVCEHNNMTYKHRDKTYKQCNLCTCLYGDWACDNTECGATCSVFGFLHVITGDGKNYTFFSSPEACSFTLITATDEFKDALRGLNIKVTTMIEPETPESRLLDAVQIEINDTTYVIKGKTLLINGQQKSLPYRKDDQEKSRQSRNDDQEKSRQSRTDDQEKSRPSRTDDLEKSRPSKTDEQEKSIPSRKENQVKSRPSRMDAQEKSQPSRNDDQEKSLPYSTDDQEKSRPSKTDDQEKSTPPKTDYQEKSRPSRKENQDKSRQSRTDDQEKSRPSRADDQKSLPYSTDDQEKSRPSKTDDHEKSSPYKTYDHEKSRPSRTDDQEKSRPSRKEDQDKSRPPRTDDQDKSRPPRKDDQIKSRPSGTDDNEKSRPSRMDAQEKSRPSREDDQEKSGPSRTDAQEKSRLSRKDDQEKFRPYRTDVVTIEWPTDEFIHANMYGIDILFNHPYALYINVDPMYRNKVTGLCGDFNKIPSDDFTISSGTNKNKITSDLLAFVRGFTDVTGTCQTGISEKRPDDNINHTMMTTAQQWCMLLKSEDVTGGCVDLVNMDLYYDTCVDDMARRADVDDYRPMCTVISALKLRCTQLDTTIELPMELTSRCASDKVLDTTCNYRENVKLCHTTQTCRHLVGNPYLDCDNSRLVSGCMCPVGHVRNDDGKCVEPDECPCIDEDDGQSYSPGYRLERKCHTCICLNGSFACCPGNQIMLVNSTVCQTTCREKATCDAGYSYTGCGCPSGTMYDTIQNKCVPNGDCPCYWNGTPYTTGSTRPWLFGEQICEGAEWVDFNM